MVDHGLQIWGLNTDAFNYNFNYNNYTAANMNAVIWSHGQSNPGVLSTGQKWGKWVHETDTPANALNATEQAHYSDLLTIQVGDEQQSDIENPSGYTKAWFDAAHAGNYFTDKLLYVNSTFVANINNYLNFIANANPDAISWDAYPFGTTGVYPNNWLGKAQLFRRAALGNYIGASAAAPRPYGLYLQTYHGGDGARDPGDLEMRWQQFTAWTLGYTFVDAFTAGGGNTSLFQSGDGNNPNQPYYNAFKETSRQSRNLGPALTHLISYGYGPSVVLGKDANGVTNTTPIDWLNFDKNNAPPDQRYLTGVSAQNLGTKNNGQPGDVYVGFFNPLHTSYGDPAGTAYFMITNALGAYLQDSTLTPADCTQRLTLDFDFLSSGLNSLQRLRRSDGQVEIIPLSHLTGSQYRYIFDLEGGTGDLFKYNDGSPFVGVQFAAPTLYWDADGIASGNNSITGAGLGGSGTWNAASTRWFNGTTDVAWSATQNAVFMGTAGTVTLASAQTVNSLAFKTNGFTLSGSSITMAGSYITVDSGITGNIGSQISGAVGLMKNGPGTLNLTGSNNYTGGTTILDGALRVSSDAALGAAPGSFAAGNISLNGGTLQFGGNFDLSNNRGISVGAAGGTIDTQGFTNPSGYTQANGISGEGDITKIGSGTFYMNTPLNALNTGWTGNLILKEGTWKITERGGLPYNANIDSVYRPGQVTFNGGTLQLAASISSTSNYRGMTVDTGGGTIDTQGFDFAWGGPLVGNVPNATLTKIGSGMLTLRSAAATGPATYSGNVNVNGGTLVLHNGTAMGDLASINLANTAGVQLNITGAAETVGSLSGGGASGGNVSLSASLITGGNNKSTTFAGVISGAGALTKVGTGVMTLSSPNTYVGGTTISGGMLSVTNVTGSGTGTGSVNVNTGGTLGGNGRVSGNVIVDSNGHLAPGTSPGTLNLLNGLTLSTGSILDFELANVTTVGSNVNDLLAVTGNLNLGSALTLNLDAYLGDLANGTYKLITYTGGLSGNTAGWSIGSTNASSSHGYTFNTSTPGEIQLIVDNSIPTWTGAVSANWSTGGNWSTAAEPTSTLDVTFPAGIPPTGANIVLSSSEAAKSITLNDNYNLTSGNISVASGNLTVASGKTATISASLTQSAALNKLGPGTLVLSSTTNSYSGGTNINAGILRVFSNANLGAVSGALNFGGGTLNTTASFSSARAVNVNSGGGTIDTNNGIANTFTGNIQGAAGNMLTKAGAGVLVLNQPTPRSGASTSWLSNIAVTGGTLKVGNGGYDGFLPGYDPIAYAGLPPIVPSINLSAGSTLEFNHGNGGAGQYATHAVVISGAGNVVISGPKTETFVANNTYTGATTIGSGSSLRIGWGGASNVGGLGATAITNNGSLTFSNDHNTSFPGSVSGSGSFVKEFGGTLTVTGSIAHSGGTDLAGGTLQVGDGGTTGSISGNITNSASLVFNRSNSASNSSNISGSGSVSQVGTGALTLGGANSYTGGTTIQNGTLQVSSDANLGAIPGAFATNITLDNGGTLRFGGNFDIANTRGISIGAGGGAIDTQGFTNPSGYNAANGGFTGPGDLTKLGSGTFFAATGTTGANTTWKGKLILNEGTWKIVASDGLPYNPPLADGLQAAQITLDGGTWQIGATLNVTNGRRGITVASGGGAIDTPGFDLTWAGPLAGSVSSSVLNKTGSGILRFTGASGVASTYAGTVNVNAGTLRLDNGITMGDLASVNLANVPGATLNVTGNETIGSLAGGGASGGNVTLSAITLTTGGNNNSTTFAGNISGAGGFTKTGAGAMTLTGGNSYTGGTRVQAGTLEVKKLHTSNAVTIDGGTLRVLASDPTLPAHPAGDDAFVSRPSGLTISNNGAPLGSRIYDGALDLTNNDLILDYSGASPIASIEDMVRAGYHGGDWLGNGITSSIAAADGNYMLAIADNASLSQPFGTSNGGDNFDGVNVDLTSILIKFTHRVDLNLDGLVTDADAIVFSTNYEPGSPAYWAIGDFNYDGVFTDNDAILFSTYYDASLQHLPEPASLGLLALGLTGWVARRRNRRA